MIWIFIKYKIIIAHNKLYNFYEIISIHFIIILNFQVLDYFLFLYINLYFEQINVFLQTLYMYFLVIKNAGYQQQQNLNLGRYVYLKGSIDLVHSLSLFCYSYSPFEANNGVVTLPVMLSSE